MPGTPRRKAGLLAPQVEGYRFWLAQHGYTPQTIRNMLKDLGQVGLWLSRAGLQVNDLSEDRLEDFLAACRGVRRRVPGMRGMAPLLAFLRETGAVAQPQPAPTPMTTLLEQFRSWMEKERGLAAATVLRYENTARRFLTEQAMTGVDLTPARLSGADLNAFLLRECERVSAGSAKGRVAELRALMRFLHLRGAIPLRLGTAVPPVGGWRLATVPPTMAAADVQLLLDRCPRDTAVGVRDYAILMVVARLGLRSIEVARLELGDVDWRAGEIVVRGKGRRQDRLPLPAEVGDALVTYLAVRPAEPPG